MGEQIELRPGIAFGAATVMAFPEMQAGKRCVRVECWSCKERRTVGVWDLTHGKVGLCRACSLKAKGVRYGKAPRVDVVGLYAFNDQDAGELAARVGP